jgi:hypothetical protein
MNTPREPSGTSKMAQHLRELNRAVARLRPIHSTRGVTTQATTRGVVRQSSRPPSPATETTEATDARWS